MQSEINKKEIDHAKDIDLVMPMYNLIEYSHNFWKILASVRQSYKYEPFIDDNGVIIDAPDDPGNASFKYKQKITG